jgi:hypothetical protein
VAAINRLKLLRVRFQKSLQLMFYVNKKPDVQNLCSHIHGIAYGTHENFPKAAKVVSLRSSFRMFWLRPKGSEIRKFHGYVAELQLTERYLTKVKRLIYLV